MAVARSVLHYWLCLVVAGAVLFGLSWIIFERRRAVRRRPDSRRRWEVYWEQHGGWRVNVLRLSLVAACLSWFLVGAALVTSFVAGQRYWATQPPRPTWPPLRVSLEVSPTTGTFTETQVIKLTARVANESDVPLLLGSLRLTMPEEVMPAYVRATHPLTQTVQPGATIWHVNMPLDRGAAWDVSIALQLTAPGALKGQLTAFVTAERSYSQVLWDVKNVRPQETATTYLEGQAAMFVVPISWTVRPK